MDKKELEDIMNMNIESLRFKERNITNPKEKLEINMKIKFYKQLKETMLDKIDD